MGGGGACYAKQYLRKIKLRFFSSFFYASPNNLLLSNYKYDANLAVDLVSSSGASYT